MSDQERNRVEEDEARWIAEQQRLGPTERVSPFPSLPANPADVLYDEDADLHERERSARGEGDPSIDGEAARGAYSFGQRIARLEHQKDQEGGGAPDAR